MTDPANATARNAAPAPTCMRRSHLSGRALRRSVSPASRPNTKPPTCALYDTASPWKAALTTTSAVTAQPSMAQKNARLRTDSSAQLSARLPACEDSRP